MGDAVVEVSQIARPAQTNGSRALADGGGGKGRGHLCGRTWGDAMVNTELSGWRWLRGNESSRKRQMADDQNRGKKKELDHARTKKMRQIVKTFFHQALSRKSNRDLSETWNTRLSGFLN